MQNSSYFKDQLQQNTAFGLNSFLKKIPQYMYELTKTIMLAAKFVIKTFLGK